MDRNAIRSGFATGDLADRIDQGLPVVRTGPAHQSSINIEKDQVGQDSILAGLYIRLK
jgi:hypothetical protein